MNYNNSISLSLLLFESETPQNNKQIYARYAQALLKQIIYLFESKKSNINALLPFFSKNNQGMLSHFKIGLLNKNYSDLELSIRDSVIYGIPEGQKVEIELKDSEAGVPATVISLYRRFPARTENDINSYNQFLIGHFVNTLSALSNNFYGAFIQAAEQGGIEYMKKIPEIPNPAKIDKYKEPKQQEINKKEPEQASTTNKPNISSTNRNIDFENMDQNDEDAIEALFQKGPKAFFSTLGTTIPKYGLEKLLQRYRKKMNPAMFRVYSRIMNRYLNKY